MTVTTKEPKSICTFSFIGYADCLFTVDWGDGQVEKINNEKGEKVHLTHFYTKAGKWYIQLKSDETHTLTAFHYTCDTSMLKALDISRCPVLTDLYCVNQNLKRLDVSQNLRLERLVCRGNQLQTLNIRKNNRLTKLDCSDNPLLHVDWHPIFSALARVCMKNTINFDQYDTLRYLLKINKGKECDVMPETPSEPVFLPLSYYIRCCSWKEIKNEIRLSGKTCTWKKHKQIFEDVRSRNVGDNHGEWEIVCDGWIHFASSDYVQDLYEVYMSFDEWLSTNVRVVEKDGWMMIPLTKPSEIASPCLAAMAEQTKPPSKWMDINWLRAATFSLCSE